MFDILRPVSILGYFCLIIYIGLIISLVNFQSACTMDKFPEKFLIGVASSSYQVEGGWNAGGKGENIWDRLVHEHPEVVEDGSNGDISANSYFLYKNDVEIIKEIGFDFYRFSVSWARILPTGEAHKINHEGIKYYNNLINELLKNGIQPMLTMYHWELPQSLQELGGWANPLIVDYFEDYARVLYENFGDRIKYWVTINEPLEITMGYGAKLFAPMVNHHGTADYLAGHHVLLAHARAYRLYDREFRAHQNGKLSLGISGVAGFPATDSLEDKEASQRYTEFFFGWFAHPIYSKEGNYPRIMRQRVDENSKAEGRNRSRLPVFTPEEVKSIRGSFDFFSLQHYTSVEVTSGYEGEDPSSARDSFVKTSYNEKWLTSNVSWLKVVPEGLRFLLNWIKENYDSPEVFITECGYGEIGETSLEDDRRIRFFSSYLKELLKSIYEDDCKVIGYAAWALLDNFEWLAGHTQQFGLVHVDFEDPERKRTKKKSANYFKKLLKTRELVLK